MGHFLLRIVGGILGLLAAFVGALVLVAWGQAKRARTTLSRLSCPQCQTAIGPDGAGAVLKEDRRRKRTMVQDATAAGLDIQIAPEWRFACPSCRSPLVFDPDAGTLIIGPRARP